MYHDNMFFYNGNQNVKLKRKMLKSVRQVFITIFFLKLVQHKLHTSSLYLKTLNMKKPVQFFRYSFLASAFLFCFFETSASEPINISKSKKSINRVTGYQSKQVKTVYPEPDSLVTMPQKKTSEEDIIRSEDFFFMNLFFLLR